jgi:hypothetical protein
MLLPNGARASGRGEALLYAGRETHDKANDFLRRNLGCDPLAKAIR